MLEQTLDSALPPLLDDTYNILRDQADSTTGKQVARLFADAIVVATAPYRRPAVRFMGEGVEQRVKAAARIPEEYEKGNYIGVIDLYMPELEVRWTVLTERYRYDLARHEADINYVAASGDPVTEFGWYELRIQYWEEMRDLVRTEISSRGIKPRIYI